MSTWSAGLPSDSVALSAALAEGRVLALDIDPRAPEVLLQARRPGLGSAMVGQRVIFRQWLGTDDPEPVPAPELSALVGAVRAWLDTPEAARLLRTITRGYRCDRLWSADELGTWSPEAWQAAQDVVRGVVAAMESVE